MIRLPDMDLEPPVLTALAKYQAEIDTIAVYTERTAVAEKEWRRRSKPQNATFRAIRKTLRAMCHGERRCGYCEISASANEIDHLWPKSLYPGSTFVWENYVYCCGLCNRTKSDKFAVFVAPNGDFTHLRGKGRGILTPPPLGEKVIIHPRFENPLDFLWLDMIDTFEFSPMYEKEENPLFWQRAEYTIDVLELNKRDGLPRSRREAYESFIWRLEKYLRKRDAGATPNELAKLTEAFQACNHQGVWQEMKRQRFQIQELDALFDAAPDALTW